MIELGAGNPTGASAAGQDLIKDTTEATFMEDVVEASKTVPVIVDFWAPWCGPCKTLGPALEQAVMAAGGKVKMVKVNVDENQMIAQQARVQSIPTVYTFVDGRPVDGFQGAVPPAEIAAFVERAASQSNAAPDLGEAVEAANQMLEEGAVEDAIQTFTAILSEDQSQIGAIAGLVRAYIAAGHLEQAREVLSLVPADKANDNDVVAARAQLELAEMAGEAAADASEIAALRAKLEADPTDLQVRHDLAMALIAEAQHELAIEELLELFRRDREWNDAAARTQLLKLLDSLGPKDPLAAKGRRRLASMIYA